MCRGLRFIQHDPPRTLQQPPLSIFYTFFGPKISLLENADRPPICVIKQLKKPVPFPFPQLDGHVATVMVRIESVSGFKKKVWVFSPPNRYPSVVVGACNTFFGVLFAKRLGSDFCVTRAKCHIQNNSVVSQISLLCGFCSHSAGPERAEKKDTANVLSSVGGVRPWNKFNHIIFFFDFSTFRRANMIKAWLKHNE